MPTAAPASLVGKTAWSSLASILGSVASSVIVVVAARALGVEGSGEMAYGVWIATTAAQVALVALPHVAMRFLASPRDSLGVAQWVIRRAAILVVPGAAAAGSVSLATGRPLSLAVATSILTAIAMLSAVGQAVLSGRQRFRQLAGLGVSSALLQVAGALIGCVLAGPVGAISGYAAGLTPFLLGLFVPYERSAPSPDVIRRIRAFALETWIASSTALVAWSRLEFVFLQSHGPDAVALYAIALTIAQLGLQPTTLLGTALLPHFGELVGSDHLDAARETFAAATRVFAFFALPLCFGLAAVTPTLAPLVFGAAFAGAALPAEILVASASIVAIAPPASALLYAHERTRFNALVAIASAMTAAASFAIVIPTFGLTGAAVARSVVQGLGVVAGFFYLARRLEALPPVGRVARAAAAAAIAAAAARLVVDNAEPTWPGLAAAVLAAIATYVLLARWLRPLEASDVRHLEPVFARLPRIAGGTTRAILQSMTR